MNGQLSEHPLAELIREAAAAKLSGALRLERERVRAVIYFRRGEVIYARSNLRANRLVASAQRSGLFAEARLAEAVTEMMDDAEAAAALVAAGASEREMARLRASQSADVMRPFLVWTDGAWSFDPRAQPAEELRTTVPLDGLLLEAARRLPPGFAAARLADDGEQLTPAAAAPKGDLQLLPVEGFLLSRVDGPVTVGELLAVSGLPEGQTRQAAYALALCGLLARGRWPAALTGDAAEASAQPALSPADFVDEREPARTEPASAKASGPRTGRKEGEPEADPRALIGELLTRVRDANYFQILGVPRAATAQEIKRAYYGLARRFHPDRFRQVVGDSERVEVETAFALVTKAYETLSDSSERAAYESKLPVESAGLSSIFRPAAKPAPRATAPEAAKTPADPAASSGYRAEESFQQGLAALERGDTNGACLFFGEAVRLAPQHARYHAFYGRALMREPATRRQAESELQAAIRLDPGNASYRVALAELYSTLHLTRRAEGELTRALSIDPNNAAARQMLSQMKGQG
ncbi:MAG TPA: DnaJ domain-containing protein [Pyrinomonadaceae bacterium]|nr:DnaJ domain-containing protein [Pyrinomonadaceae bacterium]